LARSWSIEKRNAQKLALQGKLWYKAEYSGLLVTSRSTPLGNLDQVIRLSEGIFIETLIKTAHESPNSRRLSRAPSADAGYRLIIVLAGTWNILRNQTQRRFDKELLGKEILKNDESYITAQPADWDDFLEHGCDPEKLGHFTWQRLTRPDIDFRGLNAAIDGLEFQKHEKALPLNARQNLDHLAVKLLVVKKNVTVLKKLVKSLTLLRTNLSDVPALIIDDESDQAGINTVNPHKALQEKDWKERTATNEAIIQLLKLLPRGQYVGYTATPYANALVDPDDPEDLFPKDFIVSLERPIGYMGVSDFFDPTVDYTDLAKGDFSEPEIAFIRRVARPSGEDHEDIKTALRSYLLAGAIKLFRQERGKDRYNPEGFKHHTMLVHTSILQTEEDRVADQVPTIQRGHDARLLSLAFCGAPAVAPPIVAGGAGLLRDNRIHTPIAAGKLHVILPSQVLGLQACGRQPKQQGPDVTCLAADQSARHADYLAA
jgi:hypothetical protein